MHKILNVALIAHDDKKDTLVNFCIAMRPYCQNMVYMPQVRLEKELWMEHT